MNPNQLSLAQHRLLAELHAQTWHFKKSFTRGQLPFLRATRATLGAVEDAGLVAEDPATGLLRLTPDGLLALAAADEAALHAARAASKKAPKALTTGEADALVPAAAPHWPHRFTWLRELDALTRQRLIDRGFVSHNHDAVEVKPDWEVTELGHEAIEGVLNEHIGNRGTFPTIEAQTLLKEMYRSPGVHRPGDANVVVEASLISRGLVRISYDRDPHFDDLVVTAAGLLMCVWPTELPGSVLVKTAAADLDALRRYHYPEDRSFTLPEGRKVLNDWRERVLLERSCPGGIDFEPFAQAVRHRMEIDRSRRFESKRYRQAIDGYDEQIAEAARKADQLLAGEGQGPA
jgi:hypothetical protein